jgi:RNA:NAD 2'-phosphotransferase (TPT1/KptA family)
MWQSYVVKRQTVCTRETGQSAHSGQSSVQKKALERYEKKWLFHGSNSETVDKILQQGFNRSFCGKVIVPFIFIW